jgi:hypothetical protein
MPEQGKRKARESQLGRARKGKRGFWCGRRHAEAGENEARHPDSCAGAVETGVGRAVSGAVWEQGGARRPHVQAWADRGREELGRAREQQCRFRFKMNFQTEHDLIRSKIDFILIKKFK